MESYPGRSDLNPPIPPPRHNTFTATDFNLVSVVSYYNPVDYALTHKSCHDDPFRITSNHRKTG